VRRLVALDLPAGDELVAALRRCLDGGDAVLPLDQRLPTAAKARLVEALAPHAVVGPDGSSQRRRSARPLEDGDALVVATSGTTGEPKGVVLGADALRASALAASARLGVDPGRDRWLCCLPAAHVGGLMVIVRALVTETPLTVLPRFDADAVLAEARRGATLVSLVPTALGRLGPGAAAFRTVVLGGQAPPAELPGNVVTTYGMTETASGVVYDGRPLDGVEVRVAPDGEIEVRGPMLLRCYRDGHDPKDAEGWLRTGDAGTLGADGRLVVHGRIAEVVVTGGEKVWPAAVEAVLGRHPKVLEVAVAGVPDPEWGARVVAYVVPRPGSPPTLAELRRLVAEELGPVAAPRQLELRDALPRSALGKVRRAALAGGTGRD